MSENEQISKLRWLPPTLKNIPYSREDYKIGNREWLNRRLECLLQALDVLNDSGRLTLVRAAHRTTYNITIGEGPMATMHIAVCSDCQSKFYGYNMIAAYLCHEAEAEEVHQYLEEAPIDKARLALRSMHWLYSMTCQHLPLEEDTENDN